MASKKITINAMESVGVCHVVKECENFKTQYHAKENEECLKTWRMKLEKNGKSYIFFFFFAGIKPAANFFLPSQIMKFSNWTDPDYS